MPIQYSAANGPRRSQGLLPAKLTRMGCPSHAEAVNVCTPELLGTRLEVRHSAAKSNMHQLSGRQIDRHGISD
jgi:hypothetical protein